MGDAIEIPRILLEAEIKKPDDRTWQAREMADACREMDKLLTHLPPHAREFGSLVGPWRRFAGESYQVQATARYDNLLYETFRAGKNAGLHVLPRIFPGDYERCWDCGFDHDYEQMEAWRAHGRKLV